MSLKKAILLSQGLLIICSLLSLFWNDCIGNDAAAYYVPMAELFAEGQYGLAFNPMIPPLVPCLAGIVTTVLPVNGFMGLKIVSAVFMLLGMIPMYHLGKRLVSKEQAVWACVLYAVCAQVIRFGITAQLTSTKFFLVLWLIERCISVCEKATFNRIACLAVAMSLLALCRTEGIFYICFALLALLITSIKSRKIVTVVSMWGLFVIVMFGIWSPWLVYEYKATGYPVLDSRQMVIVQTLESLLGSQSTAPEGPSEPDSNSEPAMEIYAQDMGTKLAETLDGFYIPYLPLVIIGILSLLKQKTHRLMIIWLCSAAVFNVIVIWAAATQGPPVLKRYIFPSALFVMPLAVVGWCCFRNWLIEKQSSGIQFIVTAVFYVVVAVSIVDGLKQVTDSFRGKYAEEKNNGLWLLKHQDEVDLNQSNQSQLVSFGGQWTGRSLVVAAAFPQTACWAKAQHLKIDRRVDKTMEELIDFCESHGADVLVADKHVKKSTLDFDPNDPHLHLIGEKKGDRFSLYQLKFSE